MTYYFDMDGVLADFHSAYRVNKAVALHRDSMAKLSPFAHNIKLARNLIAKKETVYILTKAANEEAKQGKLDWLKQYIPEIDKNHFICIVGYGKKIDYIRESGILFDDDKRNIREWEKGGQKGYYLEEKGENIKLQEKRRKPLFFLSMNVYNLFTLWVQNCS